MNYSGVQLNFDNQMTMTIRLQPQIKVHAKLRHIIKLKFNYRGHMVRGKCIYREYHL